MEQEIIQPIDKALLKSELTPERQLRMTNKSHNEIYVITAQNAPNVMKEIGRLREIAFRTAGGGTGKSMDIDEFDTMENGCRQLIVWNPEAEEIIGGYRYLFGGDWKIDENGQPILATSHMFHFSEKFMKEYAPYTVELGRSFVSLDYQNVRKNTKSIFALDNLWDGLGALTVINPHCKYFFGKMTMYPSYIRRGRDMILYFLKKHFDDKDKLIIPIKPLKIDTPEEELAQIAAAGASGGGTAPSEWTRSVCQCVVGGHGSKDDLQGVKEPCYCIQYGEGYDEYHYCNGRPEIVNCKCFHVGNGTAKMKRHTWG